MASALPVDGGLSELPTPPPAIRPPESALPAPAPAPAAQPPAPGPQAEVPRQPEAAPAPPPAPAVRPEPGLPAMAPEPDAPVHDYFADEASAPEPEPAVEVHSIPLMAPAPTPEPAAAPAPAPEPAVVEEQVVELAPMAPQPEAPEPAAVETEPVVEPEPVLAPLTPEPVELVNEPEVEPVTAPAAEVVPDTVRELEELFAPTRATDFSVVVRLRDGEGVEVGSFRDFGTAMEGAQEVIEQFSTATEGRWPFYAGRFIRPDLIVSVDVVEGGDEAV